MKIIDTTSELFNVYTDGNFDLSKWRVYINSLYPGIDQLFIDIMHKCIDTKVVSYEDNYLPVLNNVLKKDELRKLAVESFKTATAELDQKIQKQFGRALDVEIVLYLGLCKSAGWATKINDKSVILLGIEKIIELNWCDSASMYGLIYHELGHIYQEQYGVLERTFKSNREQYLWQLFTEGVAMYFEQVLIGDFDFYTQDKNEWKKWCDKNQAGIKKDFASDLDEMTFENQRYFGDWVNYHGYGDVGYYLGAKFVQYICMRYKFDDILLFDIDEVEELFGQFLVEAEDENRSLSVCSHW